jgi:hypothetical protein
MTGDSEKRRDDGAVSDRRRGGLRPLGAMMTRVTAGMRRRRGLAEAGILTDWPAVVGEHLARFTLPEKLTFARGERREGTLQVRVAGALATELQHLEPLVIERINRHFGYRAVGRLSIVQGPLPTRETPPPARPADAPSDASAAAATAPLPDLPESPLGEALARLGRAVQARRGAAGK